MTVIIDGHTFAYETEKLCRVFFPNEKITVVGIDAPSEKLNAGSRRIRTVRRDEADLVRLSAVADIDGRHTESVRTVGRDTPSDLGIEKTSELELGICIFDALSSACGFTPPWGILTGVRPTKLMTARLSQLGRDGAIAYFCEHLLVSRPKAELCAETAIREQAAEAMSAPQSYSLYISIPFCPSRCSYCSFVSHSIANAGDLIGPYLDLLVEELRFSARTAKELGLRLETVYVGGGTPTVLTADELYRLCDTVNSSFDLSGLREFTVESGRPDTIDADKLSVLRRAGVTRVCVNPQTLSDSVLRGIGRRHTVDDFMKAYSLARGAGFDNINCDLIAGLPGDDEEGFLRSVSGVIDLAPENITLHSFALKSASEFVTEENTAVERNVDILSSAYRRLAAAGYTPYYLYRQSKSAGCGENTGLCRPGHECLYNIFMMEEIHSVIAVGAGAVTKLKDPRSGHIERIFNLKYPYEYIARAGEAEARKESVASFYEKYPF